MPFELLLVPAFLRTYLFDKNAFNSIFIALIFRYEGILVLSSVISIVKKLVPVTVQKAFIHVENSVNIPFHVKIIY
jgi:hypothetical protein